MQDNNLTNSLYNLPKHQIVSTKLNITPKDGYFIHSIDCLFVTKVMFFFGFMPIQTKKYDELKQEFDTDFKIGMLEKATMVGNGLIAVKLPEPLVKTTNQKRLLYVKQDFVAYRFVGDYNGLKNAYTKVTKDYPAIKDFYNLYLTDPSKTPKDQNITLILFK
jgi:hypothetical protein